MKKALFFLALLPALILQGAALSYAQTVPENRYFYIKSANSGENHSSGYWDQPGSRKTAYTHGDSLQLSGRDNGPDQRYRFIDANRDWFNIVAENGGTLNIAKPDNVEGAAITMAYPMKGYRYQIFRFEHIEEGKWKIFSFSNKALSVQSMMNGTPVQGRSTGPHSEWFLIDASTGKKYIPAKDVITGTLTGQDLSADGKALTSKPIPNTEVEIWVFNPSNKSTPYSKTGSMKTDASGSFELPEKYSKESTIMLMAHFSDRETATALLYNERKDRQAKLTSLRYSAGDYVLVETKYRGKQYYHYDGSGFYMLNGKITKRDDYFFPGISERSPAINELIAKIGGGKPVRTDEEAALRFAAVWKFLKNETRSSMGTPPPVVKEASDFLFSRGENAKKMMAVKSWPSLSDYAETYKKFGFIPMGNCTSWSLAAGALLHAAGVPTDKFFVAKFNYDPSWIVEHWVIAFKTNGRWYCMDPQQATSPGMPSPARLPSSYDSLLRSANPSYDFELPFEAVLLPGSNIDRVPYCGDTQKLKKLMK